MKEFIIKNKKSVIVFLTSIVVIIVCGIVGTQLTKKDEIKITFHDNTSIGNVDAVSYSEFDEAELTDTDAGSDAVSDAVSDAASAVVSE